MKPSMTFMTKPLTMTINNAPHRNLDWDGTGKHPVLHMTLEEIRAFNAGVTDRQQGHHVDSKTKTAQPGYVAQATHAQNWATEVSQEFIKRLSESLSQR